MDDIQGEFRDELTMLRDRLIAAIRSDRKADARRGYSVYQRLVDTILIEYAKEPQMGSPEWGNEWRWLRRDIYEIAAAAVDTDDGAVIDATDFATRITRQSLVHGNQAVAMSSMELYWQLWDGVLERSRVSARHYILVALQNLGSLYLPSATDVSEETKESAALSILRVFVLMLRAAVDGDHVEAFKSCLGYYESLFEYTGLDQAIEAKVLKASGILAIVAWLLLKHDRGLAPDNTTEFVKIATGRIDSDLWHAHATAKQEASAGTMWWDRWEMELNPPLRASRLTFSSYVSRAAAADALVSGGLAVPQNPSKDDAGLARLLLDELTGASDSLGALNIDYETANRDSIQQQLAMLVDKEAERARTRLLESPIEDGRVEQFKQALSDQLAAGRRLLDHFVLGDGTDVQGLPQEPVVLELNVLVPKEYFVRTDVYADPKDLGREFAGAVLRGEESYIRERLLRPGLAESRVPLDTFRDRVLSWSKDRRGSKEILVIGVNSLHVGRALGVVDGRIDLDGEQTTYFQMYTSKDHDMACIAVDLSRCGRIRSEPADLEGLVPLDEAQIGVRVTQYIPEGPAPAALPQAQVQIAERVTWYERDGEAVLWLTPIDADW